jgi:hypothetical protein
MPDEISVETKRIPLWQPDTMSENVRQRPGRRALKLNLNPPAVPRRRRSADHEADRRRING